MAGSLRLTKFAHSCVLVEHGGISVLFDPGNYAWEDCQMAIEKLDKVDVIAVTHEHADHFHLPFVEAVLRKFPSAQLATSDMVRASLGEIFQPVEPADADTFKYFTAPHEDLPFRHAGPENTGIHFAEVFTHPGDSHSFNQTCPILAMPMTAPWGSMVSALDKITELKPKVVLPIHDWHWKPEALATFYDQFKGQLAEQGIELLVPADCMSVQIQLS